MPDRWLEKPVDRRKLLALVGERRFERLAA